MQKSTRVYPENVVEAENQFVATAALDNAGQPDFLSEGCQLLALEST